MIQTNSAKYILILLVVVLVTFSPILQNQFSAEEEIAHVLNFTLVSLLIHLINSVLVFLALRKLTKHDRIAFVSSLLFAVNPLRVEAIAWVDQWKYLLNASLILGTLLSYLTYLENKLRWSFYQTFFLVLIASAWSVRTFILPTADISRDVVTLIAFNSFEKIWLMCYAVIIYIYKNFIPTNLSILYPFPERIYSYFPWYVYLSPMILVGIFLKVQRMQRQYSFALLWFFIFILSPLVDVWNAQSLWHDRSVYLASIGLFVFFAYFYEYLIQRFSFKFFLNFCLAGYVLFFVSSTFARCGVWKSNEVMWQDVFQKYPKMVAFSNRGADFLTKGRYDRAFNDFNKAIELNPKNPRLLLNRSTIYVQRRNFDAALTDINKALEIKPDYVKGYSHRGYIFLLMQNFEAALADYNYAILLDPKYQEAIKNRGKVQFELQKFELALMDFNRALQLDQYDEEVYFHRGRAYTYLQLFDKAVEDYTNAAKYNPEDFEIYSDRGAVYLLIKKYDLAIADFNQALYYNSFSYNDLYNRGHAYKNKGEYELALDDYTAYIAVKPSYAMAYVSRGKLYNLMGEKVLARDDFLKAENLGLVLPEKIKKLMLDSS